MVFPVKHIRTCQKCKIKCQHPTSPLIFTMAFNDAEQRDPLWDILCSSQHHFLLLTLHYCTRLQNQGKTLSSTVTLQADIWHLLPPTLPHTWNYILRSTHTITFDLSNFIFCFKGWILTKDCHLWQCNHDSCTAQNCHEMPQTPAREGLLRSKHGENRKVEIMQARNKAKRLQTAGNECYSKKMCK